MDTVTPLDVNTPPSIARSSAFSTTSSVGSCTVTSMSTEPSNEASARSGRIVRS